MHLNYLKYLSDLWLCAQLGFSVISVILTGQIFHNINTSMPLVVGVILVGYVVPSIGVQQHILLSFLPPSCSCLSVFTVHIRQLILRCIIVDDVNDDNNTMTSILSDETCFLPSCFVISMMLNQSVTFILEYFLVRLGLFVTLMGACAELAVLSFALCYNFTITMNYAIICTIHTTYSISLCPVLICFIG